MKTTDQQKSYDQLLTATLTRAIDFVKFAETKNAALLTFSSAWILASVNMVFGANPIGPDWREAFSFVIPIFLSSALIAILSFLPKTTLANLHKDPDQARSLLYFGDAAKFSPSAFRDRFAERYFPPQDVHATQNYLDDMAIQIQVNSAIALRKFIFFKIGAWVALSGIATLLLPIATKILHFVAALISAVGHH